jgi:hypothetical protein
MTTGNREREGMTRALERRRKERRKGMEGTNEQK